MSSIFAIDTNVFLSFVTALRDDHILVKTSLRSAISKNVVFVVLPQTISEAWSVLTRPLNVNGLGLSPRQAADVIRAALSVFPLVPDPENLSEALLALAEKHHVIGRQVHDARLAATVLEHGLAGIVTRNTGDFLRYGVNPVTPEDLATGVS